MAILAHCLAGWSNRQLARFWPWNSRFESLPGSPLASSGGPVLAGEATATGDRWRSVGATELTATPAVPSRPRPMKRVALIAAAGIAVLFARAGTLSLRGARGVHVLRARWPPGQIVVAVGTITARMLVGAQPGVAEDFRFSSGDRLTLSALLSTGRGENAVRAALYAVAHDREGPERGRHRGECARSRHATARPRTSSRSSVRRRRALSPISEGGRPPAIVRRTLDPLRAAPLGDLSTAPTPPTVHRRHRGTCAAHRRALARSGAARPSHGRRRDYAAA